MGTGLAPPPGATVHDLGGAFVMPVRGGVTFWRCVASCASHALLLWHAAPATCSSAAPQRAAPRLPLPSPPRTQGFIDTHLHLIPGGLMLGYANLRAATSREGFQHTVAAAAAKLLPGQWLLGGQFDDNNWGGGLPEASWLDEVGACRDRGAGVATAAAIANTAATAARCGTVLLSCRCPEALALLCHVHTLCMRYVHSIFVFCLRIHHAICCFSLCANAQVVGEHPAWITRMDGHLGVANSAAMRLAGVSAVTPDPEGGTIDRDAAGQPTGIFREVSARSAS